MVNGEIYCAMLHISDNRRYLLRDGAPFFLHADTGWRAVNRLSLDEAREYLDDRVAKNVNAILFHAINREQEGPLSALGDAPFGGTNNADLTQPNEAYFRHLDGILDAARERGLVPLVSCAWFGYWGSGWRRELTPENAAVYGKFLGERYAHHSDLVWIGGGDCNPGDKWDVVQAIGQALKATAPHHLQMVHNAPEYSSATFFHQEPWLDINFAYTYNPSYLQIKYEYHFGHPVRPIILGESGYEGESNDDSYWDAYRVRRQPYWAVCSGACGHALGTWGVYSFLDRWRERLNWESARQMPHVRQIFEMPGREWWRTTPDNGIVAGGAQHGGSRGLACLRGTGGDGQPFARVYVPSPRPVTLKSEHFPGSVVARWYDTRTGDAQDTPASGDGLTFTPPSNDPRADYLLLVN